ncbi:MAG: 3-hydroxyacyl-CoA dehydrogenase family protein [Candidatus Riflebacteria bacterium]|nr:3-hydroxyacyl-CoA dehydrogenase family protein [Candidatus Riflebacteria bacterium]
MGDIRHVACLGGGIMGAGIAGFFADRGYSVDVYDLTLDLAKKSLDNLTDPRAKFPLILSNKSVSRIRPLATASMKDELARADLVIEAVPEIMTIKQKAFAEVDRFRRPGSVIATNTSGLSIDKMVASRSRDMRQHFLGIHFFNPVRYMALVEVIPGPATLPEVAGEVAELFVALGKKPIVGKDTPNFVANRIGIYMLMRTLSVAPKYGFGVEEIDMITGEAMGHPKTATFRLCDMVGIDTLFHASMNSFQNCPGDEDRALFEPPPYVVKMVEQKLLGDKTGKGFYQKLKSKGKGGDDDEGAKRPGGRPDLLVVDFETLQYRPKRSAKSDCVRVAKTYSKAPGRLRAMMTYDEKDPVCAFTREVVLGSAAYALRRVGEIADDA